VIALTHPARAETSDRFVARLRTGGGASDPADAIRVGSYGTTTLFSGRRGLFEIDSGEAGDLDGDVVLVEPERGSVRRLLRAGSRHNSLLVTERCDQLCVMCSQPPKKTHDDRFDLLTDACLLAEPDARIGITGGEPTLFKQQLFTMLATVLAARPDITFHVLTNGQHFDGDDISLLTHPDFARVQWGIPLYSAEAGAHDAVVAKPGAFDRLDASLGVLMRSGAEVELRTVVLRSNVEGMAALARRVAVRLGFVSAWSIMQLENIGFARNRWRDLYFDHAADFKPIAAAIDTAVLHDVPVRLFNFARCGVPLPYRPYAAASISDWKRRYMPACAECSERTACSGFFEWHPDSLMTKVQPI
jgi:His-Xaa-Ser system radical SAM maturase HxsC